MRFAPLSILLLAAPASAQIQFVEFASVDLSSTANPVGANFIGTHPSAIAWSGSDLYVAGLNSGASSGVAIVRIRNVLTTPTFDTPFGIASATPDGFGYTGLDLGFGVLAAAYDAGVDHPLGLRAYSTNSAVPFWSVPARGASGIAIDPGFGGIDMGVAWIPSGSDRRALLQLATGTPIYTSTDGMMLHPTGGAAWQDMSFDRPNGNFYGRAGNEVVRAVRTGGNTCTPAVLVDLTDADTIPGHRLAHLKTVVGGLVIYNDRTSTAMGQSFFDVVKVATEAGVQRTASWGAFAPPTGTGHYDFSWFQAADESVAILDCTNHRVTIFRVGLTPSATPICFGDGTGTACPCANSGTAGNGCANSVQPAGANLSATGTASLSADTLVLGGSGMPNGSALYYQGTSADSGGLGTAFGDGLRCAGGVQVRLGTKFNAAGVSQYPEVGDASVSVRGSVTAGTRVYQAWYRNSAVFCTTATFNLTNAVSVEWGA